MPRSQVHRNLLGVLLLKCGPGTSLCGSHVTLWFVEVGLTSRSTEAILDPGDIGLDLELESGLV